MDDKLNNYREKRDFTSTPEPLFSRRKTDNPLPIFLIHLHRATRLHYDIRLECEGVLKSWAVPKGLTLDPTEKHLAIQVEDHPFDYKDFEGVIPEGNYGAGEVIIWDEGFYDVPGFSTKDKIEQALLQGILKGHCRISFHGEKIKGEFNLVRMHTDSKGTQWLAIKVDDQFSGKNVVFSNESVRSGKNLDQLKHSDELKVSLSKSEILKKLESLPISKFPEQPIIPMFATLVEKPFDHKDWLFELKWDGYRVLAIISKGKVELYSRNQNVLTKQFRTIVNNLHDINTNMILDGEIVAIDENGMPKFELLQNYKNMPSSNLIYYVFDILYYDRYDLQEQKLIFRKELLQAILPEMPNVKKSEYIERYGCNLYSFVVQNQLEGIVAKEKNSTYIQNTRSGSWRKVKSLLRQEVVIGGYSQPRGGRKYVGAVLVGVYDGSRLIYVGHVGGGFKDEDLKNIHAKFQPFIIDNPPFANPPNNKKNEITWIEPVFVGEVKFTEWTSENILRQPIFLGFREDLDPRQVYKESTTPIRGSCGTADDQKKRVDIVDNQPLQLTNASKIYWPRDNISKGDLIDYYKSISPWILPHIIDRPQSLHRFPDGIDGKHFYHKDITTSPDWVPKVEIFSEDTQEIIHYVLCQTAPALLYIVNLGAIEIHPWISRIQHLDNPDFCVIDLDPLECSFENVLIVTRHIHKMLSKTKILHYIKTSGSSGMHLYIPQGAKYTYEQSRQFAFIICVLAHAELTEISSLERMPSKRRGKVYLDYLQNVKGKTMASPYSVRPHDHAPVSTPLFINEIDKNILPENFTIKNTLSRLEKKGDPWVNILTESIDMGTCIDSLQKIYSIPMGNQDKK